MRLAVLYSGGKDSNLALFIAKRLNYNINALITLFPKNKSSYMFQNPNEEVVKLQSKALGIPLIKKTTEGKKEKELEDLYLALKEAKKKFKIEGIVSGALRSTYQNTRIQKIADELDLFVFSPLWLMDPVEELKLLIRYNFKVIIVKVSSYPFNESFVGKEIREIFNFLIQNSKIINPAGEGGEYETLVLKNPLFKKEIKIKSYRIIKSSGYNYEMVIENVELK